ncbi:MAG: transcriptional regulator NrdR [Actinobacteria bacterium]|nr:transcriptional regulator NrdR [Actinomycetota bacterium]
MKCPFCESMQMKVVDSRDTDSGDAIRRRRECLSCQRRFTTYERVEEAPLVVVKRRGEREVFSRSKLLEGLVRACEKRPVDAGALEKFVDSVEAALRNEFKTEVPSAEIGDRVLSQLKSLDKVAYVRFASVYRHFEDVEEFQRELSKLS